MQFWIQNPQQELPTKFVTPFQATFFFWASQFELFVESYGHLMFFCPKFWQHKIYGKFIQCKNSTIKYTLKEVGDEKFRLKKKILTIFNEFYKNVIILQREVARG